MHASQQIDATLVSTLPTALRNAGPPTPWARQARPGQALSSFLEAPTFDRAGNLWMVDVASGNILRLDSAGQWDVACHTDGEPHGLALLGEDASSGEGAFAVTDHRHGLLRLDCATGQLSELCHAPTGEGFRGLSDVACAPNGDLWFTDPGRSSLSDPTGRLFRLPAGGATPIPVLTNVPYPNGVALGADGKHVYVSATRANAVWRLAAGTADTQTAPRVAMAGVFVHLSGGLGPDGLSVGTMGHLAIAQAQAGRVYVVDSLGDPVLRINTPGGMWTTSVVFDVSGCVLTITEAQSGSVYRADLTGFI